MIPKCNIESKANIRKAKFTAPTVSDSKQYNPTIIAYGIDPKTISKNLKN